MTRTSQLIGMGIKIGATRYIVALHLKPAHHVVLPPRGAVGVGSSPDWLPSKTATGSRVTRKEGPSPSAVFSVRATAWQIRTLEPDHLAVVAPSLVGIVGIGIEIVMCI